MEDFLRASVLMGARYIADYLKTRTTLPSPSVLRILSYQVWALYETKICHVGFSMSKKLVNITIVTSSGIIFSAVAHLIFTNFEILANRLQSAG